MLGGQRNGYKMIHMTFYIFRVFLHKEAPLFAICIGGIVAAFILRRRAPSASHWVFLACGWEILVLVLFPVIWWILCVRGVQKDDVVQEMFALAENVAFSVCILFLILAVYAGRRSPNNALEPTATAP